MTDMNSRDPVRAAGDELAAAADNVIAGVMDWSLVEGSLIRAREAWRSAVLASDAPAEPRADDGTDLRELRIDVCENCIARKPGTCHVPGCFYIWHTIDEVPQCLDAHATYVVPAVPDAETEPAPKGQSWGEMDGDR